MMRLTLKVDYDDGRSQRVVTAATDAVAFERHFDKPISVVTSRLEYMWWLTWMALTRQSLTSLSFDEWLGTVLSVEDDDKASADIVPLDHSPLPGTSSTSPTSSASLQTSLSDSLTA
jgi:hypothetical protein